MTCTGKIMLPLVPEVVALSLRRRAKPILGPECRIRTGAPGMEMECDGYSLHYPGLDSLSRKIPSAVALIYYLRP